MRKAHITVCLVFCLAVVLGLLVPRAEAFRGGRGPGWHGNIGEFHREDLGIWRSGRWFHGPHYDRFGWWWVVGGVWYLYPAPIYPYPDPYTLLVSPSRQKNNARKLRESTSDCRTNTDDL